MLPPDIQVGCQQRVEKLGQAPHNRRFFGGSRDAARSQSHFSTNIQVGCQAILVREKIAAAGNLATASLSPGCRGFAILRSPLCEKEGGNSPRR
jgi:hypothetical protein